MLKTTRFSSADGPSQVLSNQWLTGELQQTLGFC